jgi:ubiquinone/menaquinone biosynthesis C-methylase UbiE
MGRSPIQEAQPRALRGDTHPARERPAPGLPCDARSLAVRVDSEQLQSEELPHLVRKGRGPVHMTQEHADGGKVGRFELLDRASTTSPSSTPRTCSIPTATPSRLCARAEHLIANPADRSATRALSRRGATGYLRAMVEMTERLLVDAGIAPGMRVIDVGCGRGDVSLLVARLVGEQGEVLGVDRDPRALVLARERVRELGLANVAFTEGDFGALGAEHGSFDAAVGRRVLMYQADPVLALRGLLRVLRPGALVVFQEADATMVPASRVPLPLNARANRWMWQTVEREGGNLHMGFDLAPALEQAGLVALHVRAEAIVQTPRSRHPVGMIIRAMLPRIVEHGVATEAEIDVDTLDQRLAEECEASNATYIGDMAFGAWARVAAPAPQGV